MQCFGKAIVPKKRQGTATDTGGYLVEDASGKYREFKYQVKCTDGWRKVATRFYGPINNKTKVWCWCSCPYFKYHCEVALAHRGSSAVVQSNGQRPRFTNPEMKPRVCKHVYLLFALAFRTDLKREHAEKKKVQDEKRKKKSEAMKKAAEKKREEKKQKDLAVKAAREEAQNTAKEKAAERKAEQAAKKAEAAQKAAEQAAKRAEAISNRAAQREAKPLAKGPPTRASWAGDKKR
jgi:hypothetical protein